MRLFILATPLLLISTTLAHPVPLKRDQAPSESLTELCGQLNSENNSNFKLNGQPVNLQNLKDACSVAEQADSSSVVRRRLVPAPVEEVMTGLPNKRHNAKSNGKTNTSGDAVAPPSLPNQVTSVVSPVVKEVASPHKRGLENPTENAGDLPMGPVVDALTGLVGKRHPDPVSLPELPAPVDPVIHKRHPDYPVPVPAAAQEVAQDLPMGKMGERRTEKMGSKNPIPDVGSNSDNLPAAAVKDVDRLASGH